MAHGDEGLPATASASATVLLVEDDATILALFSGTLREEGYTVLTATSAQEALTICKRHSGQIDLLLADILIPNSAELQLMTAGAPRRRLSGVDLMRQVRSARPDIRVILMSGRSDQDLKSLGAFDQGWPLLRKPLGLETLVNTVSQMLSTSPQT